MNDYSRYTPGQLSRIFLLADHLHQALAEVEPVTVAMEETLEAVASVVVNAENALAAREAIREQ